jgi:sporulation protein YunB
MLMREVVFLLHRNISSNSARVGNSKPPKLAKQRVIGIRLIAVGLIMLTILLLADLRIRPMLQKAGEFHCRVLAARIVNNVVLNELAELASPDASVAPVYSAFMRFTYDDSGNILSIESDMANINRFKARITELINDDISTIGQSNVDIPLGTVSGFNILYGRGPAIPVRLTPRGAANVNLISDFAPAGINQTLHRITLTVTVEISAIVPGYTNHVAVETEFLVAQTVIVGRVPDSYANIVLG